LAYNLRMNKKGFLASLIVMLPLTVAMGQSVFASTEPTITGTITSIPMNHYVLIKERSGRPIVVYIEYDRDMEQLLVGDKITAMILSQQTTQSWWPEHSALGGVGSTYRGNLPSQLRDLPDGTPLVLPLSLKILSKSTAPQPTRWIPIASFIFNSPISLHETGDPSIASPFSVRAEKWRIHWMAILTHPDLRILPRFGAYVYRVAGPTDLSHPVDIGAIIRNLYEGISVSGTFYGYGSGTFYAKCEKYVGLQWQYTVEELR